MQVASNAIQSQQLLQMKQSVSPVTLYNSLTFFIFLILDLGGWKWLRPIMLTESAPLWNLLCLLVLFIYRTILPVLSELWASCNSTRAHHQTDQLSDACNKINPNLLARFVVASPVMSWDASCLLHNSRTKNSQGLQLLSKDLFWLCRLFMAERQGQWRVLQEWPSWCGCLAVKYISSVSWWPSKASISP